jgi:NAD(P)-dependent dehydrogenase (short-subunit alcohol dehydrogenase family)
VLDVNLRAMPEKVASSISRRHGPVAPQLACHCDITDSASLQAALDKAAAAHGPARILMNIAGIGSAKRVVAKDGSPAPLEDFAKVVTINLVGSYNVSRLFAAACAKLPPLEDGQRGVMMFTASVAAFDGQVGQQAYSASKAGLAGMTLPMARDLAQHGIRVCTVAPGLFATPLMAAAARSGPGFAGRQHSLSAAPGQARRIRAAGRAHRQQRPPERRSDPPGRCAAHGAEVNPMEKTVVYEVKVAFGDCDPAGIVFFPNFSRWMDASPR